MHNVFPIQAIDEYKPREGGQPVLPMPELEDEEEWEVEEVKDEAVLKGNKYYLVKWEGWPMEYNLWVPAYNMGNAKEVIQRFEKAKAKKARKIKEY